MFRRRRYFQLLDCKFHVLTFALSSLVFLCLLVCNNKYLKTYTYTTTHAKHDIVFSLDV